MKNAKKTTQHYFLRKFSTKAQTLNYNLLVQTFGGVLLALVKATKPTN